MAPIPTPKIGTESGFRAIYYHRQDFVKTQPVDNVFDIAYAFLDVKPDGTVAILDPYATGGPQSSPEDRGNLDQFKKLLKDQASIAGKENKEFNRMISLGGWNNSAHFSEAFSTEERRTTFVNSLSQFLTDFPAFNGISIDWEYVSDDGKNYGKEGNSVSIHDGENFILVLQKLRAALPDYTLASCCSAAPEKNHWPIKRAAELLDELHVMTYDFHHDGKRGGTTTAHRTNHIKSSAGQWSAEEAIEFFLREGVPASKIFIGGPLSSRGSMSGSTEMWDDEGKAAHAYDATAKRVDTHDNVTSILEKAKYIKEKNLGGIILWETSRAVPYEDPNRASPHKSWKDGIKVDDKRLPMAAHAYDATAKRVERLPMSGSTEMWDDDGKAAYAYDATAKRVDSNDNVTSILEKAKSIQEKKMGGIILWETSGDVPHDDPSNHSILMKALRDNLTGNRKSPTY